MGTLVAGFERASVVKLELEPCSLLETGPRKASPDSLFVSLLCCGCSLKLLQRSHKSDM